MRKSVMIAGVAALLIAGAGAGTASATTSEPWRVTYVSPDTGYDSYGLFDVTAMGADDAWAVGSRPQGGADPGAVLRWNGQSWSEVTIPGGYGSYDRVAASGKNDVWVSGGDAGGSKTFWHWDGTSWHAVALSAYDAADMAVIGPENVWVVGSADEGSDVGEARHWNGTTWQTVAMPFPAHRVVATSATDAWATGETATQPLVAHWNGTSWKSSKLPTVPIPDGQTGFSYFNDIVALASDDVWAVGRLYWGSGEEEIARHGDSAAEESEHNRPVLMHWNGHKWSLTLGPEGDFAMSVAPDGNGSIWYSTFNDDYVHLAADGTTTTVPVPTPAGRTQAPDIRALAGVPGGTKVLGVGEVVPDYGTGDESWDGVVEQYG
jgi:hypothetical protein